MKSAHHLLRLVSISLFLLWVSFANAQLQFGTLSSDQITGASLNSNDRSAVVLIHGWNPDGNGNMFADGNWPQLVNALRTKLSATTWKLLLFHWEADASTGPIFDWDIFGETGFYNAREAAQNAFLNGTGLAESINSKAPNLRKIVLIAHSAGSWTARRAADRLLQLNPYIIVNVVLLDPFIPGVDPSVFNSLDTSLMSQIGSHASEDRVFRLENYYAIDATDRDFDFGNGGGRKATSQVFSWRSNDINHRTDYNSTLGFYYDKHGGPLSFYADTVTATMGTPVPNGLAYAPWDFTSVGFYRSLVNLEAFLPAITVQPQGDTIASGNGIVLSVSANRATSYDWYKVNTGYVSSGSTLELNNLTTSGTYVARCSNSSGHVFSDKATVSILGVPALTISSISPRYVSTQSPGQTQQVTITGTNFTNASTLTFNDGTNNHAGRVPTFISSSELRYNIAVGPTPATWTAKVVNGTVESLPYTFYAVSSGAQLTGISISGPATMAENGSATFTGTAFFSDGSSLTATPTWSENSSATSISASGVLSAGGVSSDTVVTVSASYTSGGISKSASASIIVVNGGSGGGSQTTNVIVNGGFESGATPWAPTGYADVVSLSYPRSGSWYAYTGNTASASAGSIAQFVPIPVAATAATLSFYIDIVTAETTATQRYDTLKVDLVTANDQYVGTIVEFSNLDKGDNVNGTYVLKSYNIMSLLNAYKGQSLFLIFSGVTDTSNATIFRIDDVKLDITTPTPVNLTGLSISGPSSIQEGHLEAYYAKAIFSDGSTQTVSPNSWSENSSATTISASGYLTASQVTSDTAITISTSYTFNSVTKQNTKNVTVIDSSAPVTLIELSINGPGSINENSSQQYTATAIFSNGTTQAVSPNWSENTSSTSITSGGNLTSSDVSADRTVTVSASYTTGGVTKTGSLDVLIINSATQPAFSSLSIDGPSSVDEGLTGQFTATASYSDGSTEYVNPAWSENNSVTSISSYGLLSAGSVTSNTSVTVGASMTISGVTRSTIKSVTIADLPDTQAPALDIISPADNSTVGSVTLTMSGNASDSGRGNNGISSVTVNGIGASGSSAGGSSTANWNATITLNPGSNTVVVMAKDGLNNSTTKSITVNYDLSDSQGPSLAITSPSNNSTVTTTTLAFSGSASDSGLGNHGVSSVTINGSLATGGTAAGSDTANWNTMHTLPLVPGSNAITVVAKDGFNNSTTEQITVFYSPPETLFSISLSANPAAGGAVSGSGTFLQDSQRTVTATVNNGYTFANWTEHGSEVSTNASYSFNLNSNRVLVANFTEAGPFTVFSDNFNDNLINYGKWAISGNSVIETSQQMQVLTTVTDQPGTLRSKPFVVGPNSAITITRRVFLHHDDSIYYLGNNHFFSGRFTIAISGVPEFGLAYYDYDYSSASDVPKHGFFITRNGASAHSTSSQMDVSTGVSAIWDAWFDEKIVYDPASGMVEYFINDESKISFNVGILPSAATTPKMVLGFQAFGWWTGHQQFMDDLLVTQEVPPPPLPIPNAPSVVRGSVSRTTSLKHFLNVRFYDNSDSELYFYVYAQRRRPSGRWTQWNLLCVGAASDGVGPRLIQGLPLARHAIYRIKVFAWNATGMSGPSNVISIRTR